MTVRKKKKRLGKGLDALLGDGVPPAAAAASTVPAPGRKGEQLRELSVAQLRRGRYQPRTRMDKEALAELAQSIKSSGVIQPILARRTGDGSAFEIIAGERRWRAAQLAGVDKVPVIVRDISNEAAITVAIIENIQRENLNPIEEAEALLRLKKEFSFTDQQAADSVGKSRAGVTNMLRLLNLSKPVRAMVEAGDLDMGHARALLALPEDLQKQAARKAVQKKLSVRAVENLVKQLLAGDGKSPRQGGPGDPDVARLQDQISQKLGAKVHIQHGAKKGRVVIEYHGLDELDGILAKIQ